MNKNSNKWVNRLLLEDVCKKNLEKGGLSKSTHFNVRKPKQNIILTLKIFIFLRKKEHFSITYTRVASSAR